MTLPEDSGPALLTKADELFLAGHLNEAEPRYRRALKRLEHQQHRFPKAIARGMIRLAQCQKARGAPDEAAQTLEQAADFSDTHKAAAHAAEAARLRSVLAELSGDTVVFEQWSVRALQAYSDAGNAAGCALTFMAIGRARRLDERYDEALDMFERAMNIAEKSHLTALLADALSHMGNIYRIRGHVDQACSLFERVKVMGEEQRLPAVEARALTDLGNIAAGGGAWDRAVARYERAFALYESLGEVVGSTASACNCVGIWLIRGELERAATQVAQSRERLGRRIASHVVVDVTLLELQVLAKAGRLHECDALLSELTKHLETREHPAAERRLASFRGSRSLLAGDVVQAREIHAAVVASMRGAAVVTDEISSLLSAVNADLAAEAYPAATARIERAQTLVTRGSQGRFVPLVDAARASLEAQRNADPLVGAARFLETARTLAEAGYTLLAFGYRVRAADLAMPRNAQGLNEVATCESLGLALAAKSLVAMSHGSSSEVFDRLLECAEAADLKRQAAAIRRRRAALFEPPLLELLALAATERGDLWEARQCRREQAVRASNGPD